MPYIFEVKCNLIFFRVNISKLDPLTSFDLTNLKRSTQKLKKYISWNYLGRGVLVLGTNNNHLKTWLPLTKVIHTKYSKHRPSTVAHTFESVCSKINHGLNHGLFISLLKLINCPIH